MLTTTNKSTSDRKKNKVVKGHVADIVSETWDLKFKDRPDRQAFRIDVSVLKPQTIEIVKFMGENNRVLIRLIK